LRQDAKKVFSREKTEEGGAKKIIIREVLGEVSQKLESE